MFEQKNLFKEFEKVLQVFKNSLLESKVGLSPDKEHNQQQIIQQIIHNNSSQQNRERILSEFLSYGPLTPLLQKEDINEILINSKENIFYEQYGKIFRLKDCFLSRRTFHNIVEKIGTEAGITVNFKKPFNEGKWKAFRIHLLCPPVVKQDFELCLRKHPKTLWTFKKLEDQNWAPPHAIELARQFVKEKHNFLIVGSTSAGKTSVLNACLQELKPNERVLSIEDTDEIVLPNPASTKLLTKEDPESLKALIDQQCLVKQSLRLRPDRIVMGEVRGEEAKDLLLALATGHKGSIGTLHAKDHKQAIWKLETLAQMGAPQWQSSTVQRLILSSLDGLMVLEKQEGVRLLKGLYKITALERTGFLFQSLYERNS